MAERSRQRQVGAIARSAFDNAGRSASGELSGAVLEDSRQRLSVVTLLLAVGVGLAFIENHALKWLFGVEPIRGFDLALTTQPLLIGLCIAFTLIISRSRLAPQTLIRMALAFEVIGAFVLGFPFYYGPIPEFANVADITYVALWIMVFPLFVPARPREAFVAALCAAAMPILAWLLSLGDEPWPEARLIVAYFSPNVFCAFLSVVPANLFYSLNRNLSEAQRQVEQLGRYKLVRKLGEGGMGEVWQAEHLTLARPAAIKLVTRDPERSEAERERITERFKREARVTARLSSAHTVNLYDYGLDSEGTFYYVMELLRGIDLELFVERYGPMPAARVIAILEQVCDSLAEAHAHGLVHRDIKPSNLSLCRVGHSLDFVKVFDFGLVFEQHPELEGTGPEALRLTADGGFVGTPAFVAPELIEGRAVDGRADIYALGCVAVWLLTGRYAFPAESVVQMLVQHLSVEPTPPSEDAAYPVPAELDALILDCLAKDPAQRPDAEQLQQRLRAIFVEPWNEDAARAWYASHAPELLEDEPLLASSDNAPSSSSAQ